MLTAFDLCLITLDPLEQVQAELARAASSSRRGGGAGARGPLRSVRLRDPDGNPIEISNGVRV